MKQLILSEYPEGMPTEDTFEIKSVDVPGISDGEVLVETMYVSVDPYMRGRMSEGPSYTDPFEIGAPLKGSMVGRIVDSCSDLFAKGDLVTGLLDFQELNAVSEKQVRKLRKSISDPIHALTALGMPALTAYFGMMHIGEPKAGETVVVSSAAGAVGQIAGQLAKSEGARVVGIVGSEEEAEYITNVLGFDAAVKYKEGNVSEQLKATCPEGIDVYYENIGGEIGDAIWPLLNVFARIPVCGSISSYNLKPGEKDMGPRIQRFLINSRAKVQGFLVCDFSEHNEEAYATLEEGLADGEIIVEKTIYEGFEEIPAAFIGLFEGTNIGKQVVKVSELE